MKLINWSKQFYLILSCIFLISSCAIFKKTTNPSNNNNYPPSSTTQSGTALQNKYARLLFVSPNKITNISLYQFIDNWMGVPYQFGGQSKAGIDCSGLMQILYDAVYKKKIPRTSELQFNAINMHKNLQEGDLVFFDTNGGKNVNHVGLYLQNNYFLNATISKGVYISNLTQVYWKDKFLGSGWLE